VASGGLSYFLIVLSNMGIEMLKKFFLVTGLLWPALLSAQISKQDLPADLLHKPWTAQWIAVAGAVPTEYGVYHFRKLLELQHKPEAFIVHVSADNRYKLYVNGNLVCWGPARGDVYHWNFETLDLAPYLKEGENILAAQVWNYGAHAPMAQQSLQTGFILQGHGEAERIADTDASWKGWQNGAYAPLPAELHTYFVIDPGEKVDLNQFPWNWEQQDFDDSAWETCRELSPGLAYGLFEPWYEGWMLRPRQVPLMEMKPQRISTLRRSEGVQPPASFPQEKGAFTIPANTKATLLLDQSFLTTAYPVLKVSGGKGAVISLGYAESLFVDEEKDEAETVHKGDRDQVKGKIFKGYKDEWTLDGGQQRSIVPLFWRSYRYLQMVVETQEEPLVLEDMYGIYTGYPFELQAKFDAGLAEYDKILEVGWRTARLCAHATYMDTPYYEQLQYVGDTRIQALVSLFNSGDDRLMRNAIEQISFSQSLGGITMSRYPTRDPQYIPPFSLWWIGMLNDHWKYRGDTSLLRAMLPVSRSVLDYFHSYQQENASLGKMPYWNFTDWASGEGWKAGIAPTTEQGNSAPLDLQLLLAYQAAAPLERAAGFPALANEYENRAKVLSQAVRDLYWDQEKGLFADTPEKQHFSQHSNALAVLAGVVEGAKASRLMEKTLSSHELVQATIYFKYYLHQAAVKAGLGNQYAEWLDEWRTQLKRGLSTWAEQPEPTRSDCHAWGASPNIEFFRTVLGIDSDAPGFKKVLIQPHLGNLKKASGSIPHPDGDISVSYVLSRKGILEAEISLPPGIDGHFVWNGQRKELKSGHQRLKLKPN
jgi:alpha-L-rhamnosidase